MSARCPPTELTVVTAALTWLTRVSVRSGPRLLTSGARQKPTIQEDRRRAAPAPPELRAPSRPRSDHHPGAEGHPTPVVAQSGCDRRDMAGTSHGPPGLLEHQHVAVQRATRFDDIEGDVVPVHACMEVQRGHRQHVDDRSTRYASCLAPTSAQGREQAPPSATGIGDDTNEPAPTTARRALCHDRWPIDVRCKASSS